VLREKGGAEAGRRAGGMRERDLERQALAREDLTRQNSLLTVSEPLCGTTSNPANCGAAAEQRGQARAGAAEPGACRASNVLASHVHNSMRQKARATYRHGLDVWIPPSSLGLISHPGVKSNCGAAVEERGGPGPHGRRQPEYGCGLGCWKVPAG
jgi:hypothetical protein